MDWIILLHLRLTVCTVQLVATHCDLLEGSDREKDELVQTVGNEFRRQHEKWKSDRRQHNDAMDTQMVVFDNVISVGCCLRSETKVDRGLTLIRVKIEKSATRSYIPQSWVEARTVLDAIGGETEQAGNPIVGREPTNRAWAMREDIHAKFVEAITTLDASNPVSRLCKVAAHDAMEGAIELRKVFVLDCSLYLLFIGEPTTVPSWVTLNELRDPDGMYADLPQTVDHCT